MRFEFIWSVHTETKSCPGIHAIARPEDGFGPSINASVLAAVVGATVGLANVPDNVNTINATVFIRCCCAQKLIFASCSLKIETLSLLAHTLFCTGP